MMQTQQKIKKNDFIEIEFSGYANGQLFDSNIPEDLKKINPEAKPEKTVIVVGQKMLVPGLDARLEGKELGREYEIEIKAKDGFGDRHRNLIRTIPLRAFTEQKVNPQQGMILTLDNALVKIIAVSGARVTADFNNPLAGKDLKYKIKITKKVEDAKEKSEALFRVFLRFVPEFDVTENKVTVKGPKILEGVVNLYKEKFKELVGNELAFKEKKEEKKEKVKDTEKEKNPEQIAPQKS